jgi:hypothetical protein
MSFMVRIYSAGAAMVVLAGVGTYNAIDKAANWKAATAEVSYIDRKCTIVQTRYDEDLKPAEKTSYTDSCNSIDEWDKVRTKRNKVVDGTAVVHLSYVAPQNGQAETAELKFDGRDDEFYEMKAGDKVAILVNNTDPSKIRKA